MNFKGEVHLKESLFTESEELQVGDSHNNKTNLRTEGR
ncbi:hypothetical protein ZOSMA_1216G00020 [Zostera marina]|uniref:Uncharacterized protein n=1 Tax=Zostera marina TaxID=29655 RepID=A0A0K9Q0T0_ZOSMR|nr:hypothetical protein ZOSMA_1216G00020 [Zostera marina]